MDQSLNWSIETKPFTNGSSITMHYAFYTADRSRGESMDLLELDELQDILVDNIPVLEQTLVHSKPPPGHQKWAPFFKKKLYAGTPKSLSGTMEHYWKESTQCLWVVPCHSCGHWNQLTEKSIGKYGTICTGRVTKPGVSDTVQCSRPIDPRQGMWHSLKPDCTEILGVHISQLMAPRVEWGPHGWIRWDRDILAPVEGRAPGWDKVRFYNEILGMPCESALRAVTQADMMACSSEDWELMESPTKLTQSRPLYMGVDYGESRSRTVITVGGRFSDGKFAVVFARKYEGDECEPTNIVNEVVKWAEVFKVRAVSADVGHGFGINSQLINTLGMDRVFPIRYGGKTSPRLAMIGRRKWELVSNRSMTLGELFMNIKRRKIKFPKWAQWESFAKDFLEVFIEFGGRGGRGDLRYSHGVGLSHADDAVHSLNYCILAEEASRGTIPVMDGDEY